MPDDDVRARLDEHYQRGVELRRMGRLDEAREQQLAALGLDGDTAEPHHELGLIALLVGDSSAAMASFCRARLWTLTSPKHTTTSARSCSKRGTTTARLRATRKPFEPDRATRPRGKTRPCRDVVVFDARA